MIIPYDLRLFLTPNMLVDDSLVPEDCSIHSIARCHHPKTLCLISFSIIEWQTVVKTAQITSSPSTSCLPCTCTFLRMQLA